MECVFKNRSRDSTARFQYFTESEMFFVKAIFCCSLLLQAAHAASVTANNKSPSDVTASTKCHNVHFNNYQYYSEPNKEIRAHFLKIENQLADVQRKIDALTALVNTSSSPAADKNATLTGNKTKSGGYG